MPPYCKSISIIQENGGFAMGKRRKRRIYTCSDKILCGLGRMYAGGGELTEKIPQPDDFD